MFERFRRDESATGSAPFARGDGYDNDGRTGDGAARTGDGDVATRTRPTETTTTATTTRATSVAEARELQRERFGGSDGTAIFFGWLSALGLAALLIAVFAAAGTQLGFATQPDTSDATSNADT